MINKFEHVGGGAGDSHTGGWGIPVQWGPSWSTLNMSWGGGKGWSLYGEVKCIMGNGRIEPPPHTVVRQNDRVDWKHYLCHSIGG